MVGRALVVLAVFSTSMLVVAPGSQASALSACSSTHIIAVRGSGQQYGQSAELKSIEQKLPEQYGYSELENIIPELSELPKYLAIEVSRDGKPTLDAGVAFFSRSSTGLYRKSVDSGKNLLKKYIEYNDTTSTCLVLIGYSQGAQVINETVRDMHDTNPASLKNVIYIGLLGDPLYSPYGFDGDRRPPWVRGNAQYPFWGALFNKTPVPGAGKNDYIPRNPSNPLYPFTKIGSWCNYGDVICATNITHYAAMRDGHGSYTSEDISDLVDEIKAAVRSPDQNITSAIYPESTCGAEKQDLVVLLDTSAYMRRNKDLFTKDKNTWDKKLLPDAAQRMSRTFGEQLLDSGCGDKRVAIAGFEGPSGQDPRMLLDFTSRAQDIDNLMDSLYEPSNGGIAERPQVREAAILAMQQSWRPDASRTLFAITEMAGDGPALKVGRSTWLSHEVMNYHMSDQVGQRLLALSRQTRAALIAAPQLPIDMSGFSVSSGYPGDGDSYSYFQSLARLTGGYNWEKTFVAYPSRHIVKNVDFASEIQQFEKRRDATRVNMRSVRTKVGQPVKLELSDTANLIASASQRSGHGTGIDWYLDCDSLQKQTEYPELQKSGHTATFTPVKTGSCIAAAYMYTQGSGAGCYSGCPEIFPPYMLKMIPFKLEVLPADYVDKIPGDITAMTKIIYDDRVEFAWNQPAYSGDEGPIYLVKDLEGSVLAATTETRAVVTDTQNKETDVLVQAVGADGRSQDFSSSNEAVETIDIRTPTDPDTFELPSDDNAPDENMNVGANTNTQVPSSPNDASLVVASAPIDELHNGAQYSAGGQTLGESEVKSVINTAQFGNDLSKTKDISTNWLWGIPFILLALWAIYRAESAARKS